MTPSSVTCVYFSPTGTTKAVVQAICRGIDPDTAQFIDITGPEQRAGSLTLKPNDLLVIGVPVYMGRVPAVLADWFAALQARNVPVVCVVVYGNREYEDALLELTTLAAAGQGIPVAGAAYIGEHSFSKEGTPIAQGRPDQDDLAHAEAFGRQVRDKLAGIPQVSQVPDLQVPGVSPYRKDSALWTVDFIDVTQDCVQCGRCAEVCPVAAVDPGDSRMIDQEACITCCACIRHCPENARVMKPGPVMDAAERLYGACKTPKTPETFL